jgi:hypothetical protein
MDEYYYHIFNFSIHSDIKLPFLEKKITKQIPSVRIKLQSKLPQLDPSKKKMSGVNYECNEEEFLLKIDGVAKYFVSFGKTILIEPNSTATKKDIIHFLVNTVLIVLLHQRGLIPFRASAVEKDGKGILISGKSITGKSSFVAGLIPNGFKLITDEICVIGKNHENELFVFHFPISQLLHQYLY